MIISRGNLKLGVLPSFSLPPMKTCPGKTAFCDKFCFGIHGRYIFPGVIQANERRLEASRKPEFADIAVREIQKACTPAFRIHVVGDMYEKHYIEKWIEIATRLPDVQFFGSTRSWHIKKLYNSLVYLRDLPNISLRASVDITDKEPPDPSWSTWSVEGEGSACPHDRGTVKNCYSCGRCWQNREINTTFALRWGDYTNYVAERR